MSTPHGPSGPIHPQHGGYGPQGGYPPQHGHSGPIHPPQQGYGAPYGAPGPYGPPPPQKSNTPLIVGVGLLVLVAIGVAAFALTRSEEAPAPTPVTAQAPAAAPASGATAPAAAAPTTRRYANSPNDGFLALRSSASVGSGDRLAQIPHGAPVEIGACDGPQATISGRAGRWCRATYDGQTGYVFDAFLASSQPGPRAAPAPRSGGGSVAVGPTESAETLYEVTGAALNFRSGPSINASRVGALSRGDTFSTSRCEVSPRREGGKSRTWCQATSNSGLSGWVSVSNDLISVLAG